MTKPCFDTEEERLIREVLRSGWVTQGPRVAEFEERFAATVGAAESVAVTSGTTALFLSLHALGIGPGDEVIVPSLSFIASANPIVHAGATPVFVDVDPRTYNIDPDQIAAAITSRTRAVMVVHQLGLPADLDTVDVIADRHGLRVVEDAACAVGSRYKKRSIGSSNNLSCFSFHARKVIVTGEGGMIATNDRDLAARLRRIRHQGMSVSDIDRHRANRVLIEQYPEIGYNFRLSDLQAAVGLAQLQKLDGFLERRRTVAARYATALEEFESVDAPFVPDYAEPNYQSYIVRLRDADRSLRNCVLDAMHARGVATRRGLMAIHREPCYQGARVSGSLRHSDQADAQTMILPIYTELSEEDQAYVIQQLREVLQEVVEAPA